MLTRCLCQKPSLARSSLVLVFDTNMEFKIDLPRDGNDNATNFALNMLYLFLYISFPFPANLRREMTICHRGWKLNNWTSVFHYFLDASFNYLSLVLVDY